MNENYAKGYRFEKVVANKLRGLGYYAVESRGSHGTIDVVGIPNEKNTTGQVLMIQCKTNGKISKSDLQTLKDSTKKWSAHWLLADRPGRGKIRFRTLDLEEVEL